MPWQDRLQELVYTSPSGVRITGDYENVSKSVEKKTTGFEFPDANGTYVQDLGHTGRRYPIRWIFWGDDYDIEANEFEASLLERGIGKLEHPIYGTVDVVPFGAITRRDDLKTAANQAVINVTFWETIDLIYPTAQTDPSAEVLTAVDEYNDAAATEFEEFIKLDTATQRATFKNSYQALLNKATSGLQNIADTQADVQKQFDAIADSINQGINILISDPLTLAFQTTQLIQSPARALTSITARLVAYRALANSIISGNGSNGSNKFHTDDLYVSTYVTGLIVSVINNQFTTKTEALEAAELIIAQFEDVTNWRDDNFKSLVEIDTGSAYQQLQELVSLTTGFLVEISFTLKHEHRIILDHPRTIIDLVAELYGSVDDQLDFFINSNNLSGSEILELPRGREIVYYI